MPWRIRYNQKNNFKLNETKRASFKKSAEAKINMNKVLNLYDLLYKKRETCAPLFYFAMLIFFDLKSTNI